MKPETSAKLTYGFWGIVGGAAAAMIIGFNWGGWNTSSTTQRMKDEALLASQAAICAAQFMSSPNHALNVKRFEGVDSYNRSDVIEKGGWDKMPGQKKAAWNVASPCVTKIDALLKGSGNANVSVN